MTAPLPGCYLCTAATNPHSKTGMMPPRPTLPANSFGLSDHISTPFCKHCAIATVGLQLSTHNRLSRFLQPPCVLSPLPWGGEGGGYSLSTPPLGRGRGWVFPAPASLQRLRKKFTGLSVNFLQGPWSNLTAALENYYKAPGALLQGCWRNLTDTPGKPATAAIIRTKVHLRSAERKKRRLFYCIARAF